MTVWLHNLHFKKKSFKDIFFLLLFKIVLFFLGFFLRLKSFFFFVFIFTSTIEQLLGCGADPNAFLSGEDIAPIHLGPGISKSITCLLLKYGGDPNLR